MSDGTLPLIGNPWNLKPPRPTGPITLTNHAAVGSPDDLERAVSALTTYPPSAGVGRTGTYIVLDAMLKQIRSKGEVNICGFLRHIRTQRNFLVQTEEQYIFIHDALLEAIESGETNISCTHLSCYIQSLRSNDVAVDDKLEPVKLLDRQFKLVTSFQLKDFHLISANKPCNRTKNRSELLPVESARVNLTPKPGVEGSDYINATWFL
ncbi:hypothetical protein PR048_013774, partial [Dryococelus australis]